MTASLPTNQKLYDKIKQRANKKFEAKTGVYRSSWIVREYIKAGGKYKGKKNSNGLKRWYKEKWVDLNRKTSNGKYAKCGRKNTKTGSYPLCRPTKRITSRTPRTYKQLSKKSIAKAKRQKSKVKSRKNIRFI